MIKENDKYQLAGFFLTVICGILSVYLLYITAVGKVSIVQIFPVFIFFMFVVYFFSNRIWAGFFLVLYLFIGFSALIFAANKIIIFMEVGYIAVIFIFSKKFFDDFSYRHFLVTEEGGKFKIELNEVLKKREHLGEKEKGSLMHLDNYKLLTGIIKDIGSTFDKKTIENSIIDSIKKFVPKGSVHIYFEKSNDPVVNDVFEKNVMLSVEDIKYSQYGNYESTPGSCVAVPFTDSGRTFAVVKINSEKKFEFNDSDLRILSTLADIGSLGYVNARLYEKTEGLAITDGLTDLFVNSYFKERLAEAISTANHSKIPLSLIMLDIDDFKKFNDTYGHEAGDTVLKFIADSLRVNSRETDCIARYGGEEFVVILPYTKLKEARTIAERMRKWIEVKAIKYCGNTMKVTASFGVTEFKKNQSVENFINECDVKLYTAKKRGKNYVV